MPLLFLQLALFAGRAAMLAARQSPDRFRPGLVAPFMVAAVASYALGIDGNFSTKNVQLIASLMVIALAWMVVEHVRVFARWRWHLPWLVICATSAGTFAITLEDYQPARKPAGTDQAPVFDPSITYLALYDVEQHYNPKRIVTFAGQWYFPGNEHMHSGLRFVNGYSPTLDGEPTALARLDGLMPAVAVPAGRQTRVALIYRPRSLVLGLLISGLTAMILLAVGIGTYLDPHTR